MTRAKATAFLPTKSKHVKMTRAKATAFLAPKKTCKK